MTHFVTDSCLQATLPLPEYVGRLAAVFGGSCLLLGAPIAAQTFKPVEEVSTGCIAAQIHANPVLEAAASMREQPCCYYRPCYPGFASTAALALHCI